MHLPEMSLPVQWAAGWYAVSVPAVLVGMDKIKKRAKKDAAYKPLVGLLGAAVFVISLFPIPLPYGTSSHAVGTPLAAIVLGPWVASVLSVIVLFLQTVLFAYGGLTTLGANVFAMGVAGSFAGYFIYRLARKTGVPVLVAAGVAGLIGDLAVYAVTSFQLALALHGAQPIAAVLGKFFLIFMPTQVPLALVEAILTGGVLGYIRQMRPDVFSRLKLASEKVGGSSEGS